jgi:hypothetical protein
MGLEHTMTPLTDAQTLEALRQRVEALQDLCGAAYQLAGNVGAPERWLDALVAAAHGEPIPDLDPLFPITADDCQVVADLRARLARVREAVSA